MLGCKEEADAATEEPASASASASAGAAVDFLATFGGGKSFDAFVAAAEPHAASSTLQHAFAQRLEDLVDESPAEEGDEVQDMVKEEEKEEEQVPPWRRARAASSMEASTCIKRSRETEEPTEPVVKLEAFPNDGPGTGSTGSRSSRPASGPSAYNYGPGTGLHTTDSDGKTLRFFANGHLTFLMIDLRSRMRRCFKLVFPSFKFELLNCWFQSQENVYVCHIQGDPFKKPDSYTGSQRQWERAHGHERQRGGENLDTLIYIFTVRDHLALFRKQWNHDSKTRT